MSEAERVSLLQKLTKLLEVVTSWSESETEAPIEVCKWIDELRLAIGRNNRMKWYCSIGGTSAEAEYPSLAVFNAILAHTSGLVEDNTTKEYHRQ